MKKPSPPILFPTSAELVAAARGQVLVRPVFDGVPVVTIYWGALYRGRHSTKHPPSAAAVLRRSNAPRRAWPRQGPN